MKRRNHKTITAKRGQLIGEGRTAALARASLEDRIDWALDHASPMIEFRFGLAIVLAATPNGYEYSIIAPGDMTQHGRQKYEQTHHTERSWSKMLLAARSHAAQWAWSPAVTQDEYFVELAGLIEPAKGNLKTWIKFQRDYIAKFQRDYCSGEGQGGNRGR